MRFDHILIAYYFSIYRLRTLPLTGRMLCPPTVRIYFSAYKLFAATPLSGYPELLAHAYWGGGRTVLASQVIFTPALANSALRPWCFLALV